MSFNQFKRLVASNNTNFSRVPFLHIIVINYFTTYFFITTLVLIFVFVSSIKFSL